MATEAPPAETAQAGGRATAVRHGWRNMHVLKWVSGAHGWPWPALGIFFGAAVCAGVLILIGNEYSGRLAFQSGKAGIQLLAVAILGGAVTWAFRWLDDRRDERRRLDEYRVQAIADVQNAYYEAKRVRRALRAAGFQHVEPDAPLTSDQKDVFMAQMDRLDEARTALEKLVDTAQGQERIYGRNHGSITELIAHAEGYLGDVTKVWEDLDTSMKNPDAVRLFDSLAFKSFQSFLAKASVGGGIDESLSTPIRIATCRIQALRFGGSGEDCAELVRRRKAARRLGRQPPASTSGSDDAPAVPSNG
jgi:hypothetical protein